jgi:hypothetical protein
MAGRHARMSAGKVGFLMRGSVIRGVGNSARAIGSLHGAMSLRSSRTGAPNARQVLARHPQARARRSHYARRSSSMSPRDVSSRGICRLGRSELTTFVAVRGCPRATSPRAFSAGPRNDVSTLFAGRGALVRARQFPGLGSDNEWLTCSGLSEAGVRLTSRPA